MKKRIKTAGVIAGILVIMQFICPDMPVAETVPNDLVNVNQEVYMVLKKSCFDCHSSTVDLQWFDKITPLNFIIASHIKKGRKALNFSRWDSIPTPQQNAILYNSFNKILAGEMPLPSYTAVHSSANVDGNELETLRKYILSRTPRKATDTNEVAAAKQQYEKWLKGNNPASAKQIASSPNGIEYIPDYRNWRAISTTDRFDNGTMRIIFANETAVNAIKAHQTNPWPDGSILAKTAWKQLVDKYGNITTGSFVQVEFMIKDAKKYRKTEGWGWARWKGEELRPYGKIGVEQECISCHSPVKYNDNVFTTPLNMNTIPGTISKK